MNSSAFINVFAADADTSRLGNVFYRETTNPLVLEFASFANLAFEVATSCTTAFVATWFYMPYFNDSAGELVSYGGLSVCVCVHRRDIVITHTHNFFPTDEHISVFDCLKWTSLTSRPLLSRRAYPVDYRRSRRRKWRIWW